MLYAQAPNVVRMSDSTLLGKVPLQVLIQGVHELLCVEPFMAWIDEYGQIRGHLAALNGRDDGLFQCFREIGDLWGAIEFCAVLEATSPGGMNRGRSGSPWRVFSPFCQRR